ncbi:MAG: hypothetical protein K2K79_08665 [Paramuribaculum sp.]|nr:hypothetical protein [Paramuribaculum sp.]
MKVKKIDSAVATVCALRSYAQFVLINSILLFIIDGNTLGTGIMIYIIVTLLGPVNTFVLLLMYWLKINKRFLLDYKYTLIEAPLYMAVGYGCEYLISHFIPAGQMLGMRLYVSILLNIIIPAVIIMAIGYILKVCKRRLSTRKRLKRHKGETTESC